MSKILVASMAYDAEHGGGSVRIGYDLSALLTDRGHQVIVVCEDLFDRGVERETVNGITVLRYRLARSFGSAFRRHHAHITAVKRLLNKYLAEPPDVVHGHHPFQYVAALDLFQSSSRCCYTIHSPTVDEVSITWGAQGLGGKIKAWLGLPIVRRIERDVLQRSSAVTALSDYTSTLIAHHYGVAVARKIRKIPGWVDTEKFHPLNNDQADSARQRLGWPLGRPVIFVLRRLEPRMGLDNLLKALALVKRRGFSPLTVIGGNGSLKASLIRLRDLLGLQDDVMFMGFVPANQISLAYGACDASIIPTAQLECFGIIALEALACGKPTLVTPVGALPEVMRTFEAQWIASNNTPEGIANLLCDYMRGSLPQHSPDELRAIIRKYYMVERAVEAYEQILMGKDINIENL